MTPKIPERDFGEIYETYWGSIEAFIPTITPNRKRVSVMDHQSR